MAFLHKHEMLERLDQLIRLKATGTPQEIAQRFSVAPSTIYLYLKYMRQKGAPIAYCKIRQTYYYQEGGKFFIGFLPDY